ncbi:hypothetical protein KC726_00105 [Candidatus Woesebacteria bacterium]|nr:hypothetical protein [Candidatus Woesebacteria bacterium]
MENLGIDIKLIASQAVSFVLFFFIFKKFISTPLIKFLQNKKKEEELREKLAEELKDRKAKLEAKDLALEKEKKQAFDKAVKENNTRAQKLKDELIAQAKIEAQKLIDEAKASIEQERKQMYADMKKHIVDLSMIVVSSALKDLLSPEAQKTVTQNLIKYIPEKTKLEN